MRRGRTGADHADRAWQYDAEVRLLDGLLAELVRGLRRGGTLDRTVLIVTSDHGEAFGEHGNWYHEVMLYDEVMRVPLLIRGPHLPTGLRVADRVGLVDLAPTILDAAGIAPPGHMHGRSLLTELRGAPPGPRPLVAELHGKLIPSPPRLDRELRAVWLGRRKAILDLDTGRWEVYDLADPDERRDLAASAPDTIAEARRVLAWYDGLAADTPEGPSPDRGPLTPDEQNRLRALGYVE